MSSHGALFVSKLFIRCRLPVWLDLIIVASSGVSSNHTYLIQLILKQTDNWSNIKRNWSKSHGAYNWSKNRQLTTDRISEKRSGLCNWPKKWPLITSSTPNRKKQWVLLIEKVTHTTDRKTDNWLNIKQITYTTDWMKQIENVTFTTDRMKKERNGIKGQWCCDYGIKPHVWQSTATRSFWNGAPCLPESEKLIFFQTFHRKLIHDKLLGKRFLDWL